MEMSDISGIAIGQELDAYHDGKASPSRLVRVVVDDIIERKDMSRSARALWRKSLKADFKEVFEGCVCYHTKVNGKDVEFRQFWDWNCDKFIVGHILNDKDTEKDLMLFAKRPYDYGWYGVNWNYSLDISGKTRKACLANWKKCADEMGQTMKWNAEEGRYDYFDKKTGKAV